MGDWNPARLSPVIFTAVIAILVCALLAGLTDISWAANLVIGVAPCCPYPRSTEYCLGLDGRRGRKPV